MFLCKIIGKALILHVGLKFICHFCDNSTHQAFVEGANWMGKRTRSGA